MTEFSRAVSVRAPAAEVVRLMQAVQSWPSWNAAVSRVDRGATGPLTVGEKVTVKQPRLPAATWTVTAVQPSGFSWTSTSLGVRSTGDHWAQDTGDGRTTATLTLTLTGPLAWPTGLLLARLIRRYLRLEAEGLRTAAQRSAG